jgi:hypothetical protein
MSNNVNWSPTAPLVVFLLLVLFAFPPDVLGAELPPPGLRPLPLDVHALAGDKVTTEPG